MTQAVEIFDIIDRDEWKATPDNEKYFSSNHLIDAYLKGQRDGVEKETALIVEKIKSNIKSAFTITTDIFNEMRRMGFNPDSAYLRIPEWTVYDILITIPEKEFLDDQVLKVYDILSEVEGNVKNEFFIVNISLCDIGPDFNEKCVSIDGYTLKHAQEK